MKFLEIYKTSKDKDFAAQEAWPEVPPNRRRSLVRQCLTEPQVQNYLNKNGLGINKLMKRHEKALYAKKTVSINGWIEEVEDTDVQLKAVEMGYKLHRILQKTDEQTQTTVNVNIDPERLAKVAERLEEINRKMLPKVQTIDVDNVI